MELSWEVKGYLTDLIAKDSLGKIKIIRMRVGIAPDNIQSLISRELPMSTLGMMAMALFQQDPYEGLSQNEKAAVDIVETGNQDLLIETVLDFAKKEKIGGKRYSKIYGELNSIMERTMQCRLNKEGDIIPIFDPVLGITEKQTYIEKKLDRFGFVKTLANYKEALKTYKTSKKGSISLLRSTFESLVDEIIEAKGELLRGSRKDRLELLKNWEILKEIEKDNEVEHSYRIFSLLSHYGSHSDLPPEEVANFLFASTLAFIWFLINRYENTGDIR